MDFKESKAIYLQIADRICDEILLGVYPEEGRIPSVREYAGMVEVNANTVMRSFDYLQQLGIIYNKRGIGYFVAVGAHRVIDGLRRKHFLQEESDAFFRQCVMLGISAEELAAMYRDFINKQTNQELNMRSLPRTAHRYITHRYDRDIILFRPKNTPIKQLIPKPYPYPVQERKR